jgi:hypothetical protein
MPPGFENFGILARGLSSEIADGARTISSLSAHTKGLLGLLPGGSYGIAAAEYFNAASNYLYPKVSLPRPRNRMRLSRRAPVRSRRAKRTSKRKQGVLSRKVPTKNYFTNHKSALPQQFHSKMECFLQVGADIAAASFNTNLITIVMNGAFAPFAGASTTGFTKMSAFYQFYSVKACRVNIEFLPLVKTSNAVPSVCPVLCGATICTTPTTFANVANAVGAGLCKYVSIATSPSKGNISMGCDIAKFLGVKDVKTTGYFGNTGANPTQQVILQVWGFNNHLTAIVTMQMTVQVEFDITWFDPSEFV